jgi:sugar phosphate isomerase/epimerase
VTAPRLSVSTATTPKLGFAECLRIYREAGAEGIGIHAEMLRDDRRELAAFRASGLKATTCAPETFSILPLRLWPGPDDPRVRVEEICRGIRRLAPFEPKACTCVTGPRGSYELDEAWELVVSGIQRVARVAAEEGLTIALEPFHASFKDDWTMVTTLPEMDALLGDVDAPNTGMLFDVWHLWDTDDLLTQIREHAHRFVGVHVDDWRQPTRGWCDRALPGDGIADLAGIFAAMIDGGYEGWLDLEILSDDGTFGAAYPDSLWLEDPGELIRRGLERTRRQWIEADLARRDPSCP